MRAFFLIPLLLTSLSAPAAPFSREQFAFGLLSETAHGNGNVAVAPYSVWTALALTADGARGETREELDRLLGLGEDQHGARAKLLASLAAPGAPALEEANRIWGQKDLPFDAGFLARAKESAGADFSPVDFLANPEAARREANDWAETKTHGLIHEIIPPEGIDRSTVFVIANALYFKGAWANAFDPSLTRAEPFHPEHGPSLARPTMHATTKLAYWENSHLRAVRIPFRGGELAMTLVLPKEGTPTAQLAPRLTSVVFRQIHDTAAPVIVQLSLPRFHVRYGADLRDPLRGLGLRHAFSGDADFTGILPRVPGAPVYLSHVFHKVGVEVNEAGAEAAAATAVSGEIGYSSFAPPRVVRFNANHPFLFVIEHVPTGTVLFTGRVSNP